MKNFLLVMFLCFFTAVSAHAELSLLPANPASSSATDAAQDEEISKLKAGWENLKANGDLYQKAIDGLRVNVSDLSATLSTQAGRYAAFEAKMAADMATEFGNDRTRITSLEGLASGTRGDVNIIWKVVIGLGAFAILLTLVLWAVWKHNKKP